MEERDLTSHGWYQIIWRNNCCHDASYSDDSDGSDDDYATDDDGDQC